MNKKPVTLKEGKRTWVSFPEVLPGGKFRGYETRYDESQNRGAFVIGQNVKFTDGHTPTVRDGYEIQETEAADATPVKRAWVFERRDGVQIELKTYDTGVYAWIHGVSTTYKLLKGSFTAAKEFAFANIGQSDQLFSWCFFCNGTENPFRWTGAYGTYSSDNGSNTITVEGSVTLANLGFSATGTIIINGVEITYSGLSSQTFTGCSAVPAGPTVGDIIFQTPVELTGSVGGGTDPRDFKVAMAHDGRLHYRAEVRPSVWDYSKLDDPDNVATGSSDGDGGAKEVEFGGPITAFGKLNKTALALKNRIIKTLSFNQVGARLDSPVYGTLVSADDKSTTLGAVNQKSTISTPLGLFFITPDKKAVLLTGITSNNEPQYLVLSDPIQSVFDNGVFDEASAICFKNKIFLAFKSTVDSTYNDTVLVGDLDKRTFDSVGQTIPVEWDTPYIGWNVNDWTIIYNSTDEDYELHWHSSLNSNSYVVIDDKVDNTAAFTVTLRSHAESFGAPEQTKKCDYLYFEIKMLENSEYTFTVLYDEDGVTQQQEYVLSGTDDELNLFNSETYNPHGASPFGSQRIGSNEQVSQLKKYRYFIELPSDTEFFNISWQLSGTEENNDMEVIRYAYGLIEMESEPADQYKKAIS